MSVVSSRVLNKATARAFLRMSTIKLRGQPKGTHPLAGHYTSKSDFVAGTFAKLSRVLPHGAQLVVEHLLVKDDQAVVDSCATAKNGLRFDNRYCWVVRFKDKTIDRVRAYLDSAMVARIFGENPI
jgi:uncharacterized protein